MKLKELKKGSFIYEIRDVISKKTCKKIVDKFKESNVEEDYLYISDKNDWEPLDAEIFKAMSNIIETLASEIPFSLSEGVSDSGYLITSLNDNSTETQGHDAIAKQRTSLTFFLNDDYEEGEIEFPHHNLKVKAKVGTVLIFPSAWSHVYKFKAVKGNSYKLHTWLSF
jgi:hypothetical protein